MISDPLKTMIIGLLLFLFSCGDNVSVKNLPHSQIQFCEVVSKYRDLYRTIENKDMYLDQQDDLNTIFDRRKNALIKILKNGRIQQWQGVIDKITSGGEGAYIKVKLPCDAYMAASDSLVIPAKSHVYQSLRNYSENSKIVFSGNFLVPINSETDKKYPYTSYYSEESISDHGSMINPGFHFRYTQFH